MTKNDTDELQTAMNELARAEAEVRRWCRVIEILEGQVVNNNPALDLVNFSIVMRERRGARRIINSL